MCCILGWGAVRLGDQEARKGARESSPNPINGLIKGDTAQIFDSGIGESREDKWRSDLIVSYGPEKNMGKRVYGRPTMFLELKSPFNDRRFKLTDHKDQLVYYVKEIIGRHASVSYLPFVLLNRFS